MQGAGGGGKIVVEGVLFKVVSFHSDHTREQSGMLYGDKSWLQYCTINLTCGDDDVAWCNIV